MSHNPQPVPQLRESLAQMMNAHERVALLDEQGTISAINGAWREGARKNGGSIAASGRGVNFLALCEEAAAQGEADAKAFASALRSVMEGEAPSAKVSFSWRQTPEQEAASSLTIQRVQGPLENWYLLTYSDAKITDRIPTALPEMGLTLPAGTSRKAVQTRLERVTSHVALLETSGEIFAVNGAWAQFARDQHADPKATGPGANYLDVCEGALRRGDRRGAQFAQGLRSVLEGARRSWWLDSRVTIAGEVRLFRGRVSRVETPDGPLVIVSHTDLSASAHEQPLSRAAA